MYYLMARYYKPDVGRFISKDPDPGDSDDPVTQNGYTYANNNPVMSVDPDGHWAWLVAGALIGAITNVVSYAWENRDSGYSWSGFAKSAAVGAISGAVTGGLGRVALAAKAIKIQKIGRLGSPKEMGYFGVRYIKNKKIRSIELHTPHNKHGWHLQKNKWTNRNPHYPGKYVRSGVESRKTLIKAKDWR